MAYYAVALWKQSKIRPKGIQVQVVQPRIRNGLTIVDYQEPELEQWLGVLLRGGERALLQVMTKKPELRVGHYCWWCKARDSCPEYAKTRKNSAAEDFA